MSLTLELDPTPLTIHRFSPEAQIDPRLLNTQPLMLTRTDNELSVVCAQALDVSSDAQEGPWVSFHVQGPIDFNLTGVLAGLAAAIAAAEISIFAVSTYDTDLILVREQDAARATDALLANGYQVR